MPKIRIAIVDDHPVTRQGLRSLLAAEPDMEVVGEAGTGVEAVHLAEMQRPHIMLLDARLEDLDGPEVCQRVLGVAPKTAVVMLSGSLQDSLVYRCLTAGAKGYLVKDVAIDELKKIIRAVYRGNAVLDPRVTPSILAAMATGKSGTPARSFQNLALLDEIDLAIIRYLSRGLSTKEIAPLVNLSPHTVKDRIEKIGAALEARSRTEIVAEAFRKGLLAPA